MHEDSKEHRRQRKKRSTRKMDDKETKKFYKSAKWIHKREQILRRDHYECQICRQRITSAEEDGRELPAQDRRIRRAVIVHHIRHLKDFPELALDDDNLISVCHECHDRLHERDTETLNAYRRLTKPKAITEEKW